MKKRKPNIFRRVLWFEKKLKFDLRGFEYAIQPERKVSHDPRFNSGKFYSKKLGRDVEHESGLELNFIESHLEYNKNVTFYCEQPKRIPFWRGAIKTKYWPDLIVHLKSGYIIFVEVKPLSEMLTHRVQAKIEGLMEFCAKRGFGLLLTDGKHIPADLAKGKVNRKLEKELKAVLATGPIRQDQWLDIKQRCDAKPSELYRAIIRLDLKYATKRFKLQNGRQSPVFRKVYFGKAKYDNIFINLI